MILHHANSTVSYHLKEEAVSQGGRTSRRTMNSKILVLTIWFLFCDVSQWCCCVVFCMFSFGLVRVVSTTVLFLLFVLLLVLLCFVMILLFIVCCDCWIYISVYHIVVIVLLFYLNERFCSCNNLSHMLFKSQSVVLF